MVRFALTYGSPALFGPPGPFSPRPRLPEYVEAAANDAALESARFRAPVIVSGKAVVAEVRTALGRPQDIDCELRSPGFWAELLAERTKQGGTVLMALRIYRRPGTLTERCEIAFVMGYSVCTAEIAVMHVSHEPFVASR